MSERFSVRDKRILVTGASSGLGEHFARTLAAEGARVMLAARREDRLKQLVDEINGSGGDAYWVSMDVTDSEKVTQAFETTVEQLGGLDVVVNNSGIARTVFALHSTDDDFDSVLNTNLRGAWLVARAAGQVMSKDGGGHIINTASILSFRVIGGLSAYSASKAALKSLTESLALEWARYKIRVNAIAPGYIRTEINSDYFDSPDGQKVIARIPQRRLGEPSDLEGVLLLLASDASGYMTGSTLVVDGGHLQIGM